MSKTEMLVKQYEELLKDLIEEKKSISEANPYENLFYQRAAIEADNIANMEDYGVEQPLLKNAIHNLLSRYERELR